MEDKTHTVYLHINPKNKKVYAGITNQNVYKRWKNGHGYTKCKKFYNAIVKYGWDNFHHIVLSPNLTKYEVNRIESSLISYYVNLGISYNIAPGGFGIIGPRSEKHKRKISKSLKGVPKSEIAKQNMRNNATHHGGKEVAMFDKDNNLIKIFKTCGLASKETGINATHIARCARGVRPCAGGYIWRYKS